MPQSSLSTGGTQRPTLTIWFAVATLFVAGAIFLLSSQDRGVIPEPNESTITEADIHTAGVKLLDDESSVAKQSNTSAMNTDGTEETEKTVEVTAEKAKAEAVEKAEAEATEKENAKAEAAKKAEAEETEKVKAKADAAEKAEAEASEKEKAKAEAAEKATAEIAEKAEAEVVEKVKEKAEIAEKEQIKAAKKELAEKAKNESQRYREKEAKRRLSSVPWYLVPLMNEAYPTPCTCAHEPLTMIHSTTCVLPVKCLHVCTSGVTLTMSCTWA